jgi:hypothetical protein
MCEGEKGRVLEAPWSPVGSRETDLPTSLGPQSCVVLGSGQRVQSHVHMRREYESGRRLGG